VHNRAAPKNVREHVIHIKNYTSDKKQETRKNKYRSAAVLQAILTPDDGQYTPKHVVYRRQSERHTTCGKPATNCLRSGKYKTPAICCSYIQSTKTDVKEHREPRYNIQHRLIIWQ
jgi:hypothetical protein